MKIFAVYKNPNTRTSVTIAYDFYGSMFKVAEHCSATRRVKYFEYLTDAVDYAEEELCRSLDIEPVQRNINNEKTLVYWRNEYGITPIKITYTPGTTSLAVRYALDDEMKASHYTTALSAFNLAKSYCENYDIDFWQAKF